MKSEGCGHVQEWRDGKMLRTIVRVEKRKYGFGGGGCFQRVRVNTMCRRTIFGSIGCTAFESMLSSLSSRMGLVR